MSQRASEPSDAALPPRDEAAGSPPSGRGGGSSEPASEHGPLLTRTARVVAASNRAAAGVYADKTGPVIAAWLRDRGFEVGDVEVVPDGDPVAEALRAAVAGRVSVVITTGGTGISPTDRTPEATLSVLDYQIPGLADAIRAAGLPAVPTAVLSRGVAGVAGGTLVINLPGSTGGVRDGLGVLDGVLEHALDQLAGGDHVRSPGHGGPSGHHGHHEPHGHGGHGEPHGHGESRGHGELHGHGGPHGHGEPPGHHEPHGHHELHGRDESLGHHEPHGHHGHGELHGRHESRGRRESRAAVVLRAEVSEEAVSVEELAGLVADRAAGAVVTFAGVVRDHDHGRAVAELTYEGHPSARAVVEEVAAAVAGRRAGVRAVAVSHRVGQLKIGDVALACAVSAEHRREAFEACADLVDEVKLRLPVWKHQVFTDGTDEWVNCP